MITKHLKTAVITELAIETPCFAEADRERLRAMLADTFAVVLQDGKSGDLWRLRVLLRDGNRADTVHTDGENWGAIEANMAEMA